MLRPPMIRRRTLLQLLASAAVSLGWRPSLARAQAAPLDAASVGSLRAIAPAVLPTALGAPGADKAVDDFLVWLRGHKAGADLGYGYGILRKRVTPTIAPATYREQLAALEQTARATGGPLATRSVDERRAIVTQAIDAAGVKAFPDIPDGRNVIADFMSFYFNSSEANDLCHEAKIGRAKCRTLAGSSSRPEPLKSA
jgi:hypothetical protein